MCFYIFILGIFIHIFFYFDYSLFSLVCKSFSFLNFLSLDSCAIFVFFVSVSVRSGERIYRDIIIIYNKLSKLWIGTKSKGGEGPQGHLENGGGGDAIFATSGGYNNNTSEKKWH